jgi:MFS family permease
VPLTPTLIAAVAVDLVAVTILAGPLYFRRHRRRDLMLSYVALNVGVLGVALALSGSQVGVGLGLGLFGVLSIVRLRSDQISQAEIAYYFTALALGLLAGIGATSIWMPAVFAGLLLAVLYVVDHPRLLPAQRRRVVTLDRAYLDETELRRALSDLLGGKVLRLEVLETDLVRDVTVVDVRYRMPRGGRANTPSGPVPIRAPFPVPDRWPAADPVASAPSVNGAAGAGSHR